MAKRPHLELQAHEHAEAIRQLREQFPDEPEDSEAFQDTLEGMTDFYDALDYLMKEHKRLVDWADICRREANDLIAREGRLKTGAEQIKTRVLRVLEAIGRPSVQRPTYTLSRREGPPSVIVINPELLPEKYLRRKPAPPPEPDKQAIARALKSDDPNERDEVCLAALLNNGPPSLDVRRK